MTDTADLAPPRAKASPRPLRAETAPPPPADTTSPYLGLRSFSEADRELFHGREAETDELFHLVQRETLSIVFGVSGLGKSSLLRAGLFPQLRKANLFPVAIRLTYGTGDLVAQIRAAIATEIAERGVEATHPSDGLTLWEYFHRTPFWSARNRPLVPVIVLDQFEELFTLGHGALGRRALLTELGDLIENRIPEAVRRTSDADALPPTFQVPKAKVILSLREDYLARLEDLRAAIPSIARGRFRLRPMNGAQALRAVHHERTEHLVDAAVAERIVRFVAGARGEGSTDTSLDALAVEPALLSLVCRQLDEVRRSRNVPTISADLLTGETGRILADFYEGAVHGLDPQVVAALEDRLITPDGHRTIVAMSGLAPIEGLATVVSTLVDRRILRIEPLYGRDHVEVIHDVLTRVIIPRRDQRRDRAARRRRTRRLFAAAVALSAATALTIGAVLYLGARHELDEERRRAAQASARTLAAEAAAVLSHGEPWSAARLIDVAHGMSAEDTPPEIAVMASRFTALAPLLRALAQPSSPITALAFSEDGAMLFAGHRNGSVSMWSTTDWKVSELRRAPDSERTAKPVGAGSPHTVPDVEHQGRGDPRVRALGASRDGRFLAVVAGGQTVIWNTRDHTPRGVIDAVPARVRIDDDADVVLLVNSTEELRYSESSKLPDELHLYRDGQYRAWPLPAIPPSCETSARKDPAGSSATSSTVFALSGDGSTFALYQSATMDARTASATSLFTLPIAQPGDKQPALLATRCGPAGFTVERILLNADGTAITYQRDPRPCLRARNCEDVEIYHRSAAGELVPVPAANPRPGVALRLDTLAFDARRPDLLLSERAFALAAATLDGRPQRTIAPPCGHAVRSDLSDGRLVTIGACGQFVVLPHDGAAVVGELPVTQDSAIEISAAGQLAAIVTSDRALRVWQLAAVDRWLVQARGPASFDAPLAWIRPFAAGTSPGTGPLLMTRDGAQVIAAGSVASTTTASPGSSSAGRVVAGMFDVSGSEIKPAGTIAADPSSADGLQDIRQLELDPGGQRILGVGNGRVAIWDRGGTRVLDLGGPDPIRYATFSPDGARLATLAGHRTCLWSARDGHLLGCTSSGAGQSLVFDADDRVIAADEGGALARWALPGAPDPIGASDVDAQLAVDRGHRWIAAAGRDALRVWDLQHCTSAGCPKIVDVQDRRGLAHVRFVVAAGKTLVIGVGNASRAHVIDLGQPSLDDVLPLTGSAQDIDISADGRALLCEGDRVEEWDVARRRLVGMLELPDAQRPGWCSARYAQDGRVVTRTSDGTLAVWPSGGLAFGLAQPWSGCVPWGARTSCHRPFIRSLHYSRAGHLITDTELIEDTELTRMFAAPSGDLMAAVTTSSRTYSSRSIATRPVIVDGATLTISRGGQLQVMTDTGEVELRGRPAGSEPRALAADPTSGEALWIDAELRYRLIDWRTAQPLAPEHPLATSLPYGFLRALRYAPSGRWMLGARSDGTLTRFDADGNPGVPERFPGGAHAIVPALHGDGLLAIGDDAVMAWTADGTSKVLQVTGGIVERAAVWDMATGAVILGLSDGLASFDLASGRQRWRNPAPFTPTQPITWVDVGTQASQPVVVAAGEHGWGRFRFEDGAAMQGPPSRAAGTSEVVATWSVERDRLVTLDDHRAVTVWDARTATALSTVPLDPGSEWVPDTPMVRRPDGSFAAITRHGVSVLRIVDTKLVTEAELTCDRFRSSIARTGASANDEPRFEAIDSSPDGRWIAAAVAEPFTGDVESGRHHGICVWDTSNQGRSAVKDWDAGIFPIAGLSFSQGDRLLAHIPGGASRLWAIPGGNELAVLKHEDTVTAVFARGRPYAVTEDPAGILRLYDARTGNLIAPHGKPLAAGVPLYTAVDGGSGTLAVIDQQGNIAVIDVPTGAPVRDWSWPGASRAIAIAPGGRVVATVSRDQVALWNPIQAEAPLLLDAQDVTAVRFSPDGRWLAAAGHGTGDRRFTTATLLIWSTDHGTLASTFQTERSLYSVAWSNDSLEVAVGGDDGYLERFRLAPEPVVHSVVHDLFRRMTPSAVDAADRRDPHATPRSP